MAIVLEYMDGGTLADVLSKVSQLESAGVESAGVESAGATRGSQKSCPPWTSL
jgi:hypothetical protein